jgi:hypothetical protein
MEEHFVWVTTRQIKPGTLADFERVWRPGAHPEGKLPAYAYWSEDEQEVVGVSFWAYASRRGRPSAGDRCRRLEGLETQWD